MFEIVGRDDKHLIYEHKDAESSEDITEDVNEAQIYIEGQIGWDACSHIYFGDEGYIHICGGDNWKVFIEANQRIFDIAREYFVEPHQREYFDKFYKLK